MADIEKALTYEIKKEIADRYFGLRRLIEKDQEELAAQVKRYTLALEQKICTELVRIYLLLADDGLIQEFIELAGLGDRFFYDPYLLESPAIRARLLQGRRGKGLTPAGRFRSLLLESYKTLEMLVALSREKLPELQDRQAIVTQEIALFYRKNDLGNIMGFLRALDQHDYPEGMTGGIVSGSTERFEKKLRLEPPPAIAELLTIVPPLRPLDLIRKDLKKLSNRAYNRRLNCQP